MITTKNKFGLLHSYDDQPSLIDDNGNKYWHINGVPSRLDISLPYIEMSNGYKKYNLEDGGHREISHKKEEWFNKDNLLHREDAPAYIFYGKNRNIEYETYYLNNIEYTKQDYLEQTKDLNSCNKMS